jgi:hypothetical protein
MRPLEDLLLPLLRPRLTGISVQSLLHDDQTFPVVLVRSNGDWGNWSGDRRFIDTAQLNVQVFCDGLNADEDAAILSEAVRVVLIESINKVVPGWGHIIDVDMVSRPRRVADWASSTGPVQYADLPTQISRYETLYEVVARRQIA